MNVMKNSRRGWTGFPRALAVAALLAPVGLWNGCFTEVGNPDEEEMTLVMRVASPVEDTAGTGGRNAPDSVQVTGLVLRLTGVDQYARGKRARTLWANDSVGRDAALSRGDSVRATRLAALETDSLVVRLRAHPARAIDLDTVNWETFSDPGYLKGVIHRRGVARRFLFALSDSLRFAALYDRDALEAWRDAKGYHCLLLFHPRAWMNHPAIDTAKAFPTAGGDPVVVFDETHNPAQHAGLTRRLARSFNDVRGYGRNTAGP